MNRIQPCWNPQIFLNRGSYHKTFWIYLIRIPFHLYQTIK